MKGRVYIAGKLNADAVGYLYNVHKMMTTAEKVRKAGYAIFVPAIDLLLGIKFGYTNYHDYFDNGQEWLKASDAVVLVDNFYTSKGTYQEIKTALDRGIPVYRNVDDLKNERNAVKSVVVTFPEPFKFKAV